MKIFNKDKRLGVVQEKRRYDLPLNKDEGSNALVLLLALMSFMAAMTLAGSFAVGAMANRWSSGLENKMTIEIPAEDNDGENLSSVQMNDLKNKAAAELQKNPHITHVEILDKKDVQELVEPWLGKSTQFEDIPLPGLLSVETDNSSAEIVSTLRETLKAVSDTIELDTHETWLSDLLRLTRSLHFIAMLIACVIGAATASAIAGAVKSRVALYRPDVELLHFMGASDYYIMRQFQRHAIRLSLKGSIMGVGAGILTIMLIAMMSGMLPDTMLPVLRLNFADIMVIMALPLIACLIGAATARFTVMRVLSLMP